MFLAFFWHLGNGQDIFQTFFWHFGEGVWKSTLGHFFDILRGYWKSPVTAYRAHYGATHLLDKTIENAAPSYLRSCRELQRQLQGASKLRCLQKMLLWKGFGAARSSKRLLERAFEATVRSKSLLERAFEATVRSKSLLERAFEATPAR